MSDDETRAAKRAALAAERAKLAAEQQAAGVPPKQAMIQVRLDAALAGDVAEKARQYGGVSAVVRALLRRWVESDELISTDDVLAEVTRGVAMYDRREPPSKKGGRRR